MYCKHKSRMEVKSMELQRYDILIENIRKLPLDDKQELKSLLEKYIIEEKRQAIYTSYKESIEDMKKGKLKFSSDIQSLKQLIDRE